MASLPTPYELAGTPGELFVPPVARPAQRVEREQLLAARAELESHRLAVARVRARCRAAGPLTSRLAGQVLDLLGDLPA